MEVVRDKYYEFREFYDWALSVSGKLEGGGGYDWALSVSGKLEGDELGVNNLALLKY